MQATILARLPKRRYESVITSLNRKIGTKGFDNKDFIAEIIGHYEMFVEPFKNRQNRENQDQRENKERGKHLALNTTSGKGAWRTFKGKCNKCGRQGHRARDCRSTGNSNNSGEKDIERPKVKCYSCGGFGHIARDCPKKEESGMFVGMTIHGPDIREDDVKKNQEAKTEYFDTNKFAIELLQEIADYNRKKRSVLKDIREFKWKPRKYNKFQQVKSQKKKVEKKTMSWADMCETSDEEEYDDVDENENRGIVDEKEIIYQMEKTSHGAEWMWDEEVFATNSLKTMSPVTESGHESWLVDSGATTHVSINTIKMSNLQTATEGEHVRVGNNETLKATAIGDLTLEQKDTKKTLKLEKVMVVPGFARNLISVGRLTEKGNEFVAGKEGSKIFNDSGGIMSFETGTDGMAYLIAQRVAGAKEVYNIEEIKNDDGMIKKQKRELMNINEAHRKFGHATEKVVRKMLQALKIIPVGKMLVCDGCARAKATQKRTNKVTTVVAEKPGERIYMDTSGPYSETVMGSRYWYKFVDDKTRKSWDFYGARKNGITKVLKEILDKLKAAGKPVKYLRCDNAGEHMFELRKICEGEYGIQLEYTAPHTPQHNGVVERMFSRDAKRALAMMISAAWTKEMQAKLWAEATKTAAILGNSLPNTRSAVPPDELFYGKPSDIYTHLIEFGRVGYVTNRSTMKGKFKEKANPMVMIG